MLKKLLKKIAEKQPGGKKSQEFPREFLEAYEACREYTMVPPQRSFALYNAVQYIARNNIPGDFVECGVWRGGQSMLMVHALSSCGKTDRTLYLYDTYTGMSEPTDADVSVFEAESAHARWEKEHQISHNAWCYASLDDVKANMARTGYPKENLRFIKGRVEETIPDEVPEKIALLRLDTDWYESTYHELVHLYPRLVHGGVLLLDDYDYWDGARKAVDQYIAENNLALLLHKTGKGGGRIAVKCNF